MHAYAPVEKYETDFEYNPDGGLPDPVGFWSAAWQPNCGNDKVFNLSPYCQQPGIWSGSTAQRNVVGIRGREYVFGGDDSCYLYASPPLNITGPITIIARIYVPTPSDNNMIVGAYQEGAAYPGYGFGVDLVPNKIAYWSGAHGSWVGSTTNVPASQWVTIGVSVRGTVASFFLNGIPDGTAASEQPDSYAGHRRIGATSDLHAIFTGRLRYVLISPSAFSAAQHWLIHKSTLDGSPGVMARPIGPRWFPAAVAGGYTVPLQLILECAQ